MARYVLLLLLPLLACKAPGPLAADRDPNELFGPSEAGLIVVDAILIVDAPLPPIILRHTLAPRPCLFGSGKGAGGGHGFHPPWRRGVQLPARPAQSLPLPAAGRCAGG